MRKPSKGEMTYAHTGYIPRDPRGTHLRSSRAIIYSPSWQNSIGSDVRAEEQFMPGAEVLLTISGIAVSLAGFAGLAVRFQTGDHTSWPAFVIVRLRSMIEVGLIALLLALFPFILFHLGVESADLWRAASTASLLALTLSSVRIWRRSRPHIGAGGLSPGFSWGMAALSASVSASQLLNVFKWDDDRALGIYLIGLFWLLLFGALMFLRLMVLDVPSEPSPQGEPDDDPA
jgi:hypothetical protein